MKKQSIAIYAGTLIVIVLWMFLLGIDAGNTQASQVATATSTATTMFKIMATAHR